MWSEFINDYKNVEMDMGFGIWTHCSAPTFDSILSVWIQAFFESYWSGLVLIQRLVQVNSQPYCEFLNPNSYLQKLG